MTSHLLNSHHRALKDEIAEKYVVISELSSGAAEMNKIFLNLAATSDPNAAKLSDSSSEDNVQRSSTRKSKRNSTDQIIDELLGDPNIKMDPSERSGGIDASTKSMGASESMRKNRLLNFMRKHRTASQGTAKKMRFNRSDLPPLKRRGGRRSRYVH